MEDELVEKLLADVRDDLTDGQDLALASQLVSDVLVRRVRRSRQQLDTITDALDDQDADYDALIERIEQLRRRTDEFEEQMRGLAERMRELTDGYESELTHLASTDRLSLDAD